MRELPGRISKRSRSHENVAFFFFASWRASALTVHLCKRKILDLNLKSFAILAVAPGAGAAINPWVRWVSGLLFCAD